MPVHIEEMTSEVTIVEGELPMTAAQLDKLVKLVIKRLTDQQKEQEKAQADTRLQRQASRPFEAGS